MSMDTIKCVINPNNNKLELNSSKLTQFEIFTWLANLLVNNLLRNNTGMLIWTNPCSKKDPRGKMSGWEIFLSADESVWQGHKKQGQNETGKPRELQKQPDRGYEEANQRKE